MGSNGNWSARARPLVMQMAIRNMSNDMHRQFALAIDNLEAVLTAAGMGLVNITRLNIYTTDVDEALRSFDVLGARLGPVGIAPPMTLLGVTRLAMAPLLIEIEATAAE